MRELLGGGFICPTGWEVVGYEGTEWDRVDLYSHLQFESVEDSVLDTKYHALKVKQSALRICVEVGQKSVSTRHIKPSVMKMTGRPSNHVDESSPS